MTGQTEANIENLVAPTGQTVPRSMELPDFAKKVRILQGLYSFIATNGPGSERWVGSKKDLVAGELCGDLERSLEAFFREKFSLKDSMSALRKLEYFMPLLSDGGLFAETYKAHPALMLRIPGFYELMARIAVKTLGKGLPGEGAARRMLEENLYSPLDGLSARFAGLSAPVEQTGNTNLAHAYAAAANLIPFDNYFKGMLQLDSVHLLLTLWTTGDRDEHGIKAEDVAKTLQTASKAYVSMTRDGERSKTTYELQRPILQKLFDFTFLGLSHAKGINNGMLKDYHPSIDALNEALEIVRSPKLNELIQSTQDPKLVGRLALLNQVFPQDYTFSKTVDERAVVGEMIAKVFSD